MNENVLRNMILSSENIMANLIESVMGNMILNHENVLAIMIENTVAHMILNIENVEVNMIFNRSWVGQTTGFQRQLELTRKDKLMRTKL